MLEKQEKIIIAEVHMPQHPLLLRSGTFGIMDDYKELLADELYKEQLHEWQKKQERFSFRAYWSKRKELKKQTSIQAKQSLEWILKTNNATAISAGESDLLTIAPKNEEYAMDIFNNICGAIDERLRLFKINYKFSATYLGTYNKTKTQNNTPTKTISDN